MLWLRLECWLLLDGTERSWLVDLVDEWRSGTTTTGIAPFLITSFRALRLEIEFAVELDAKLSRGASLGRGTRRVELGGLSAFRTGSGGGDCQMASRKAPTRLT